MRMSDWSSDVCSSDLFVRRRLDETALEELEELLILADIGPSTAAKLTAELARSKFGREVGPEEIRTALAEQIAAMLEPVAQPIDIERGHRPHVFLVVGVNGAGKTTTIRSAEHTSELQSLMRISYAVFCLNKKKRNMTQRETKRKT